MSAAAPIITVWNSKGGVGKTSLTLLLSAELALRGEALAAYGPYWLN
ncbi:MAG TPA: hypothetical protein VF916_05190 [Ktedonobacterales bacterium]